MNVLTAYPVNKRLYWKISLEIPIKNFKIDILFFLDVTLIFEKHSSVCILAHMEKMDMSLFTSGYAYGELITYSLVT